MRSTTYGTFDPQRYVAALPLLVRAASSNTTHACARAVKTALSKGGIRYPGDVQWQLAKDNGPLLEMLGFRVIGAAQNAISLPPGYTPRVGDVAVVDTGFQGGRHAGHISIYTTRGWVSDFKQNRAIPYRKPVRLVRVFRHSELGETNG